MGKEQAMTTPEEWDKAGICYAGAAAKIQAELLNEISNLKHDYAIVSAERNNLKAHAKALAEALKYALHCEECLGLAANPKTIKKYREALAQYKRSKQ
jgi:hypothetical protein